MGFYTDKVAIVTGAGSGIGLGLTTELLRDGAIVVASDISGERMQETAKRVADLPGTLETLTLDVTDKDAVHAMVHAVKAEHGRLDYIFNNAGIAIAGRSHEMPHEDWEKVLDINLRGVLNGITAAYPIMVEQGSGHIVSLASVEGLVPFAGTAAYVASKHAVVGLSTALRVESRATGVKVSAVCPGYIKTRIFEDSKLIHMDREKVMAALPSWVGITGDECARRILVGVRRDRTIIPITAFAWILWLLNRLSPDLVIWLMAGSLEKAHRDGIVTEPR